MSNRNWHTRVATVVVFLVICTPFEAAAFLLLPDSVTRKCASCDGPPEYCEVLYKEVTCQSPNNYCVNHIVNNNTGSRTVERKCADFNTCYNEWYLVTSKNNRCHLFDQQYVTTLDFQCTYCCTTDNCNVNLHPDPDTLYKDKTTTTPTTTPTFAPTATPTTTPTTQTPAATSKKVSQPYQDPATSRKCASCDGPPEYCEVLYTEVTCQSPNNYCVNHIVNDISGSRTVERKCADFDTCYKEWYLTTSDNDRCRIFDQKHVTTLDFQCTYCCTADNCNVLLHPAPDTLYKDKNN